jgi:hypothetical protein
LEFEFGMLTFLIADLENIEIAFAFIVQVLACVIQERRQLRDIPVASSRLRVLFLAGRTRSGHQKQTDSNHAAKIPHLHRLSSEQASMAKQIR